MTRRITAEMAGSEFGQIMDRAVDQHDRFVVDRNGEPALLILSVADYLSEMAPTPNWLREIHEDSVRNGTSQLTMADIDEEIAAVRAARRHQQQQSNE